MKAETDMHEFQERLHLALESVSDGIWDWDFKTGKVYWSPRSYTMLGYEPDEFEVTYEKWRSLVHPEDIKDCETSVQKAMQTDDQFLIEFRFKRKDGSWQWTLGRGRSVAWDSDGSPTRLVGTNVDLTDQKKNEAALVKSESELKAIYENAPLLMLLVDRDRRVVKMNDQALKFSGRTMEDNVGLRVGEVLRCVHAFDDPNGCRFGPECEDCGVQNAVINTFETGQSVRCREVTIPYHHHGGQVDICVLLSTTLLDGFDTDVVLVCLEDITERKHTENELRRAKEFTETALDSQQDTFFLFDPNSGKAIRWNKSFTEITGYTDQEIAELATPYSYYSKEDINRAIPFIQEVLENGSGTIELDLICKDGHTVPFEYRVSVVYDEECQLKYLISIGRDITEREISEDKIKQTQANLLEAHRMAKMGRWDYIHAENNLIWTDTVYDIFEIGEKSFGASFEAFMEMVHPDDRKYVEGVWKKSLEDKKPYSIDHRLLTSEGLIKWVREECRTEFGNDGSPVHSIGIVQDITDRRNAEQRVLESKDRFRQLFENMSSGVAIYQAVDDGKDFVFVDFNRAGENIEKVNRKDIIGKRVTEVFPGVESFGIMEAFREVWQTGQPKQYPLSFYQDNRLAGWRDNFIYKLPSGEIVAIYEDKTEIKLAEQAIRDSENLLSASFSSIQDGMIFLDKDLNVVRTNPVADKWCSSGKSVVGSKCFTCFRNLTEPCEPCPTLQALDSGQAQSEIVKGFEGSGIEWLEVFSYPLKDLATGEITGVVEFLRDISERKRAEDALQESESKLLEAQQMAQLGYWYWDVNSGEVEWSEQVYRIFRLDPSEFIPQIDSIQAMSPWPKEHQRDKELIRKAMESHEKGEYEQKFLRPDGSVGYYYSTFQGIYDEKNQPIAIKGTVQDITERKLAENKLLEHRERLDLAQEAVGLGMFDWNIITNKAVCSGRYFSLFGLEPQDNMLSEQDWLAMIHPEDRQRAQKEVRDSLVNKAAYDTEYRVVWPDGTVRWVSSKAKFFYDNSGMAYRMIGAMIDITERKRVEEFIKNYNTRLENEVKERTEELRDKNLQLKNEISERIKAEKELKTAVSQLIQSEKLATVGQLAAGVAHEINTPLGAIGSSNSTIQQQFESLLVNINNEFEILKENAELINQLIAKISESSIELTSRQARQVRSLITEQLKCQNVKQPETLASFLVSIGLVDGYQPYLTLFEKDNSSQIIEFVSKISNIISGSKIIDTAVKQSSRVVYALRDYARADQEEVMVSANIKDTIDTAIVLYGNRLKHGIDLKIELDDVPKTACHPHELCQVWTNLISNAVHAMDNCGTLFIRLQHVDNNIQVTITDSGCGIPVEIRDRIFDPLFTTKPVGEGTGLGLDIVKRIIERHHGTLQLESRIGYGTTFMISIPIVN